MTPTLEQIARETAEQVRDESLRLYGIVPPTVEPIAQIISRALQTATKQPEGADWAEAAASEITERASYAFNRYIPTADIAAIIRKHAPLVANRKDSERDSKRLDWLEKYAEDLFRDRAPDANGGWFCVRETFPQSKDKPFGEFVCKAGNTLRAAIDAAMRPAQSEREQGKRT